MIPKAHQAPLPRPPPRQPRQQTQWRPVTDEGDWPTVTAWAATTLYSPPSHSRLLEKGMRSSVGRSLCGSHNLNHRIQLSYCASLPTAGSAHYSMQEASSLIPAWWIKGNITFLSRCTASTGRWALCCCLAPKFCPTFL